VSTGQEGEGGQLAAAMSRTVVVRDVVKRYPLFSRRRERALALFGRTAGLTTKTALDGVSLEVSSGEAVGIIGENGSGKSTLLRLIAGISSPDSGVIETEQPVAGILELGLGFHPEFTGRENATLYGALLGLPKEVMRERLDDILQFAELGEFIDLPLRTYSSGMTARLAFAVATNVRPRVLLVDEALAVGDTAFQRKCVDRMVRFKEEGRSVLFCSHAMYLVTGFCERAVWLHHGRVERSGLTQDVVEAYEGYLRSREKRRLGEEHGERPVSTLSIGRLQSVRIQDLEGAPRNQFTAPEGLEIVVAIADTDPREAVHVGIAIDTLDGRCVLATGTHWAAHPPLVGKRSYVARLRVPALPLASGRFLLSAFLLDGTGLLPLDQVVVPAGLTFVGPSWTGSLLRLPHEWVVDP